jgi:hypothetical protein
MKLTPSESTLRWHWWLVVIVAWGLVGLIGYCVWRVAKDGRLAEESASWPSVSGTVLSSTVSASGGGYRSIRSYGPVIRYRFTVDGRVFEGGRTAFNGHFSQKSSQEIVDAHRAGDPVLVHYRPGDPEICVLQPGVSTSVGLIVLIVLIVLSGLILVPTAAVMTWFGVLLLRTPPTRAGLRRKQKSRARAR